MSIYKNNLDVIEKTDKELYKSILEYEKDWECDWIQSVPSKDNNSIIRLVVDDKAVYLNSQYAPLKEAEKFAEQYKGVIDYSFVIIIGLGNGVIARQMRKYLSEHVSYLFYEPSKDIFMHVINNYDMTDLFEDENIRIIVREFNDKKIDGEIGARISAENYKISIFDALPKYKTIYSKEYEELETKYRYVVNLVRLNIGTVKYFGKDIALNELYNMRYLVNCNCESEFEGVFPTEDMVAIVVSAGPSLEKNVQLLKKAKGHALIIAVDTAVRYLVAEGIDPDFAVTVDPHKPVQLFEDEAVREIPLAIHACANREIVELMKDKKLIYMSADSAYLNKIFQLVGKTMYTLKAGGSVATVAFSLAITLGYNRLVLVGQDLALTDNKVHAGKDDVDTFKLDEDKIEIDGYNGGKVYTSPDYKAYLDWFEVVIGADPDLEVINATEGGAKIDNTIQMPLAEVINKYCQKSFDFEGMIKNYPPTFQADKINLIIETWKKSVLELNRLDELIRAGIHEIEKGIRIIEKGNYNQKAIQKMHKKIDDITSKCAQMDEIYYVDQMISSEYADILGDIYEMDETNDLEHCRILKKLKDYFEAMLPAVGEVRQTFETIIKEVE